MPKVKLGTVELDDTYRHIMRHIIVDTPVKKLCKILNLSESCLYLHKRRPELVTIRELRILRQTGRMTDEQILAVIRKEDKLCQKQER